MHWSEHYIGQPYEPDTPFCAVLAVEVQRNTFGRTVAMPTTRRVVAARRDPSVLLADYGVPTDAPVDGDAVLMRCGQLWHIGTFARVSGEEWVLHATRAAGAAHLTRLRDLPAQGLRFEGFYRWS
jgi:hypothetical protein